MQTTNLLAALNFFHAQDAEEEMHRQKIIAFVESNFQHWWKRSTADGHVTASAWVVNPPRTRALLLYHAKLDCWVQPGGHLDDADQSPVGGALREASEETGLGSLQLVSENLFDVDVHAIPARATEPAHLHYDLRYLIISSDSAVTISDESLGARWIALDQLALPTIERSISRMAKKSMKPEYFQPI